MKTFADYFEIVKFATPETNVRLKDSNIVPKNDEIIIKKCFDWQDLMHLYLADTILTRNGIFANWYIPYKPFARQDRTTAINHANESLVFWDIFHSLKRRLIFLDVHSENHRLGKTIHQLAPLFFHNIPSIQFDTFEFKHYSTKFTAICPDAGASKKINFYNSRDVIYCTKKRDPITGRLSNFIVPDFKPKNRTTVVIDDICDGGGTFIGIAKQLQLIRNKSKLVLYITHGLFTKGLDELFNYYDIIVTTNSVNDIPIIQNLSSHFKSEDSRLVILDVLSDEFIEFAKKEELIF